MYYSGLSAAVLLFASCTVNSNSIEPACDEDINPPFFFPEAFAVQGDTFFVSDGGTQKLVAFNSDGQTLWSTDGPGEGPGLFSGVSQLDVLGDRISVINLRSARIDFFSTAGGWLNSVPVLNAYDVQMLNDSLIVAVKQTSQEGCAMLLSTSGDTLSIFGQWEEHAEGFSSNRDLHCAVSDSNTLVITSYYSDIIDTYNMNTQTRLNSFCRILPVEIEKPDYHLGRMALNTIILDVFIGPEGMINTLLRPFSLEKSLDLQTGIANCSVVDRFDFQGRYLDSYVLPVFASLVRYENGLLYVCSEQDCTISTYDISVGGE